MGRKRVGIIGGGASGMMAAVIAAWEGADVTILEKNDRIGKKLLVTGNGKCNLSNLDLSIEAYHSGSLERTSRILEAFSVEDTIRFFRTIGLFLKEKNGYIYPASEQASAVLDVFRYELQHAGIHIITGTEVKEIRKTDGGAQTSVFCVSAQKEEYEFDAVILACGSKAGLRAGTEEGGYALARQLGHTIVRPVPALVQLRCQENFFKSIAGVRCSASLQLLSDEREIAVEYGELQLTDYGISGIPVFQLSRFAAYELAEGRKVQVRIDFFPEFSVNELCDLAAIRCVVQSDRTMEEFLSGTLHKKLCMFFLKSAGLRADAKVTDVGQERIKELFCQMKQLTVTVTDTNSFANAQVCAGGVSMEEVTDTLESTLLPGFYFAGEILDVDGRCGGYNLQWAWASGHTAGYYSAVHCLVK